MSFILLFLIGFAASSLVSDNDKHGNFHQSMYEEIPGTNLVPTSYDLLRDVRMQQIFDHTYNKNRVVCPHGNCYSLSDSYAYKPVFDQSTNGRTTIIETMSDWETSHSEKTTVSVSVDNFFVSASAKYSEEYKTYKQVYTEYESIESDVVVEIDEHDLWIRPGLMKLRDDVAMFALSLPPYFNNETAYLFFQFFSLYGTAFISRARFGGRLIGTSLTTRDYYREVDRTEVIKNAEASFFITVTKEEHYSEEISQEYEKSTTSYEAYTIGGKTWNPADNYIKGWADTVKSSTALIHKDVLPIYELFCQNIVKDNATDLLYRCDAVTEALYAYLKVLGCTDFRAENYDQYATVDDGSCVSKISYSNEFSITTSSTSVTMKLMHSNNTFCYVTYTDNCENQCSVFIDDDGYWYSSIIAVECVPTNGKYCGSRCSYFEIVTPTNIKKSIQVGKYDIYTNLFGSIVHLQKNEYFPELMYKHFGYCRVVFGGESCKVNIDENDFWYAISEGNDECDIACYTVEFE